MSSSACTQFSHRELSLVRLAACAPAGAACAVGGVFLVLAAAQLLPCGVNVISQLPYHLAYIAGGGTSVLGLATLSIALYPKKSTTTSTTCSATTPPIAPEVAAHAPPPMTIPSSSSFTVTAKVANVSGYTIRLEVQSETKLIKIAAEMKSMEIDEEEHKVYSLTFSYRYDENYAALRAAIDYLYQRDHTYLFVFTYQYPNQLRALQAIGFESVRDSTQQLALYRPLSPNSQTRESPTFSVAEVTREDRAAQNELDIWYTYHDFSQQHLIETKQSPLPDIYWEHKVAWSICNIMHHWWDEVGKIPHLTMRACRDAELCTIVAAKVNDCFEAFAMVRYNMEKVINSQNKRVHYIHYIVTAPKNLDRSPSNHQRVSGAAHAIIKAMFRKNNLPIYLEAARGATGFYDRLGFVNVEADLDEREAKAMLLTHDAYQRAGQTVTLL